MQEFEEDYYAILGVEEDATAQEVKKAYLKLAKQLHPDRYPNDPEQRARAQREFARVTRAHDIVADDERRAEYNAVRILQRKKEEREVQEKEMDVTKIDMTLSAEEIKAISSPRQSGQNMNGLQDETINVKWANKHLLRADELLKRRRYQEAETAMKEAIRLCPKEPRYHNKLAEIYHARGWNTLAMTEVQTTLRIDPRDPEARTLEARIKNTINADGKGAKKKGFFDQLKEILTKKL